jgi:hypothetical protein
LITTKIHSDDYNDLYVCVGCRSKDKYCMDVYGLRDPVEYKPPPYMTEDHKKAPSGGLWDNCEVLKPRFKR